MDDFTPTPEQVAIIDAAQHTSENLLVSALAGAAKTSTLVRIAEALPDVDITCLAFNKKIATEMQERLPENCTALTLNSLGYRIWMGSIRRRAVIDVGKNGNIIHRRIAEHYDPKERSKMFEAMGDLIKIMEVGKNSGWIPDSYKHVVPFVSLCSDDEFFAGIPEKLEDYEMDLLIAASCESLDMAWAGEMDYSDQILMPTLFSNAAFPRPSLVLVDEAQDLSPLNHKMVKKLVGSRRIIAVGDECQAIYGFRGADSASMFHLEREFGMKKFMLSISFRCPKKVVEAARWRAPHMQYPEWAKDGSVDTWHNWEISELPGDAAIVCRNNAPLFRLAITMLKNGRYAQIVGNDIGRGLLKIMKKFGPSTLSQAEVLKAIDGWLEAKLAKTHDRGPLRDRADCMKVFAEAGETLGQALAFAESVFNADSPVKLMTGHKAKGLEFDHVFMLDRELLGDEQQDKNLKYVMQTRAKETLTYINSEGCELLQKKEKTDA